MRWFDDERESPAESGPVTSISRDEWFAMLAQAGLQAPDPNEVGACLLRHPVTGQRYCVAMDRGTCKTQKGRWLGGNCP